MASYYYEHYDQAEYWCKAVIRQAHDMLFDNQLFDEEIKNAASQFCFPVESLTSLLRNIHLVHIKKKTNIIRKQTNKLVSMYVNGISILELAKEKNYPPYLLSRIIVEKITCVEQRPLSRKAVTQIMRDPTRKLQDRSLIHPSYQVSEDVVTNNQKDHKNNSTYISREKCTTRLAFEILTAVTADPLHGPKFDEEAQIVGMEHEVLLEQSLIAMGIPFETEEQLRMRGTSRTPDVLLSSPVGIKVKKRYYLKTESDLSKTETFHDIIIGEEDTDLYDWKMVCWIDSKARYGDVHTHKTSVLPQAETYVHRFGPGLIVYWYGHAPVDLLGDAHGDICVVDWSVSYDFMLPDGELITSKPYIRQT